jgi:hypothetical protein
MQVFQHELWGYVLNYPEGWVHQTANGVEIFAASAAAFDSENDGPDAGQVLVKAEWNSTLQPVEPLWNHHIGMLAGLIGAKQVGSAPWSLAGASGLETEIQFPKHVNRRLWTGVLKRDFLALKFMVLHPKTVRAQFEPAGTLLISSLRFPSHLYGTCSSPEGIPLPPEADPISPNSILSDIPDPDSWRAYSAPGAVGALQAFYLRELPALGWEIQEFLPFPHPESPGFARFKIKKQAAQITLGLFPIPAEQVSVDSPAQIVLHSK